MEIVSFEPLCPQPSRNSNPPCLRVLLLEPGELRAVPPDGPAELDGRDGARLRRPHLAHEVAEALGHVALHPERVRTVQLEEVVVPVEVLRQDLELEREAFSSISKLS